MSDGEPAATSESSRNSRIFLYFGTLTLFIYFATPTGYLLDISTSYMLKNQLHATANQVSQFRVYTAIPVYFAFLFGFGRDLWNPLKKRDRGYFMIFAPLTAATFLFMAFIGMSYTTLLVGVMMSMVTFRFVMAAYQGLISLIGQEKLMSGRLSTLWNIVNSIPILASAWSAGYVTEHLKPNQIFILLAVLTMALFVIGFWKPKEVFDHAYDAPEAKGSDIKGDIKRLLRHKAIYPAVLIMFLWNFAPGFQTPLQFYLTNQLHASDATYSNFVAIFAGSFIPTFFLFGYLCKKVVLRKLLVWGTVIAVPQMIPLAFVHSPGAALWLAVPIGLMGGVATAAYYDLSMRSCPPGLQGTLMMLVDGVLYLAQRGGDLLGSKIYDGDPKNGFNFCVVATTVVYAAILPVIFLVPKPIMATKDGEQSPEVQKELMQELAEG
jgi:predicted MFS family arabinose efflux permease